MFHAVAWPALFSSKREAVIWAAAPPTIAMAPPPWTPAASANGGTARVDKCAAGRQKGETLRPCGALFAHKLEGEASGVGGRRVTGCGACGERA
jgi:hypothetical protein